MDDFVRSKKIIEILKKKNMTQRYLARRLSVSDATISRLVNGDTSVKGTLEFWKRLEKVLGIDIQDL